MKKRLLSIFLIFTCSLCLFAAEKDDEDEPEDKLFGNPVVAMSEKDYFVTSGDVYTLAYAAGTSTVSYTIPVDSTYKIRVSNLAVIDAKGKTYIELKKQIEEIVTHNYPLSGVQFVLTSPSVFKIVVRGEVTQTTEVAAWALSRLSTFVNPVVTNYSSLRNVTITSIDGTEKSYDLFKANRFGDLANDPFVRPGDIVTVNHVDRVVSISGAVERPGTYQLLDGENMEKLVNYYAGGLTDVADPSRIQITRPISEKDVSGEKIYIDGVKSDSEYILNNHDTVYITAFSDLKPVMFMEGAVGSLASGSSLNSSARLPVQFERETNYAYFIRSYSNYFKSSVSDNDNAYIIRGQEIIPININLVLYDSTYNTDLIVMENDVLMVPFKQYFVTVAGAVRAPGRYPYIPDRSWDYYIGLAGGFIDIENDFDAVLIKDINGKRLTKKDPITPECSIVARSNSATYVLTQYSALLTAISTLFTAIVAVWQIKDKIPR